MIIVFGYIAVVTYMLILAFVIDGQLEWYVALYPVAIIVGLYALGVAFGVIGWAWKRVFNRRALKRTVVYGREFLD